MAPAEYTHTLSPNKSCTHLQDLKRASKCAPPSRKNMNHFQGSTYTSTTTPSILTSHIYSHSHFKVLSQTRLEILIHSLNSPFKDLERNHFNRSPLSQQVDFISFHFQRLNHRHSFPPNRTRRKHRRPVQTAPAHADTFLPSFLPSRLPRNFEKLRTVDTSEKVSFPQKKK